MFTLLEPASTKAVHLNAIRSDLACGHSTYAEPDTLRWNPNPPRCPPVTCSLSPDPMAALYERKLPRPTPTATYWSTPAACKEGTTSLAEKLRHGVVSHCSFLKPALHEGTVFVRKTIVLSYLFCIILCVTIWAAWLEHGNLYTNASSESS